MALTTGETANYTDVVSRFCQYPFLITIRALGDALAWARTRDEAAEELWVDVATLEARLRSLHPAERAYLNRRLSGHDAL